MGSKKFLLIFTVAVTLTLDHHTKFENETLNRGRLTANKQTNRLRALSLWWENSDWMLILVLKIGENGNFNMFQLVLSSHPSHVVTQCLKKCILGKI